MRPYSRIGGVIQTGAFPQKMREKSGHSEAVARGVPRWAGTGQAAADGAAGPAPPAIWRSANRWSLPVSVLGSFSTNSMARGYL